MTNPISSMDHSVAFSCLLKLYPDWYGKADSRDTGYVTDHLVNAWRQRVADGDPIDCYTLAKQMENDLRAVLDQAEFDRVNNI